MGPCTPSSDQLRQALVEARRVKFDREQQLMERIAWALQAIDLPHYCCLLCGFRPLEGMEEFLRIHGADVRCLRCKAPLGGPDLDHVREILKGEY